MSAAGSLDDDPGMKPQSIIYWGSRALWFVHTNTMEAKEEGV